MKISSLFDLITDANDLLDFFVGVDTPEQFVSRLERLKRQGSHDMLACIEGLRISVSGALSDTLEMNSSMDEPDINDDLDLDNELANLDDEIANPASEEVTGEVKKDIPPAE